MCYNIVVRGHWSRRWSCLVCLLLYGPSRHSSKLLWLLPQEIWFNVFGIHARSATGGCGVCLTLTNSGWLHKLVETSLSHFSLASLQVHNKVHVPHLSICSLQLILSTVISHSTDVCLACHANADCDNTVLPPDDPCTCQAGYEGDGTTGGTGCTGIHVDIWHKGSLFITVACIYTLVCSLGCNRNTCTLPWWQNRKCCKLLHLVFGRYCEKKYFGNVHYVSPSGRTGIDPNGPKRTRPDLHRPKRT